MSANRPQRFNALGQSLWLDGLCRGQLRPGGELQQLLEQAGIRGVATHLAVLERAICESRDYDEAIGRLARQSKSAEEMYETLLCEDVGRAADILRPLYERTEARDGFACLPVAPTLAGDTKGTVAESRRLWARLHRPNIMVLIPGTGEGLPAIQQLVSEGINVNVTLLCSMPRYEEVAEAYVAGLQRRLARGESVAQVASVASFCLRRIDGLFDRLLEQLIRADGPKAELARQLQGQVAIALARVAYQSYEALTTAPGWQKLASQGARPQRLLWANLGRTHLGDRDVEYVDALIGPDTISSLSRTTLEAYRAGDRPRARLVCEVAAAERWLRQLREVRIDLTAVSRQLEDQGVRELQLPFHRLLATLEKKRLAATELAHGRTAKSPVRELVAEH